MLIGFVVAKLLNQLVPDDSAARRESPKTKDFLRALRD
jgi:hypothetical protein